jgi:hypothetical protein
LDARDVFSRWDWSTGLRETFPPTLQLAAAYPLALWPGQELLACVQAEQSFTRHPTRLRAGVEYSWARIVALRAGYADGSPAAGAGVRIPWIGWGHAALQLDYALLQDPIENWDHWFTLSLEF